MHDAVVADALHVIDEGSEALLARVVAWSNVNSGSLEPTGLARMAGLIEEALGALPGEVDRAPLPPTPRWRADGTAQQVDHGDALRLRVRPNAPVQIALTGHFDTVFPASSPFQQAAVRDDGVLHGPGVADMKGGIAVMLEALRAFERLPHASAVGYEALLSPDEEIGSPASGPLLADLGRRAHLGLVYEPAQADGGMVDARKGSGNFTALFRGRSAHVGRAFAEGRNAVVAAAEAAAGLHRLNGRDPETTINVGAIDGGAPVNQVPEHAALRFNARAATPEAAAAVEAEARAIIAAAAERLGVEARVEGGFGRPAKPMTPALRAMSGWVAQAGRDLGLTLRFAPSGGVCEGNNLAAVGCPAIDTLGPCGGGLHTTEEFAVVSSFAERAKLSLLILDGLARGRFDLRELSR